MSALGLEAVKSPEAFRTISEVADELNVPQHVLRFWESRFAQIKPLKRAGARRYYRPEDVDLLRGIRTLLYVEGLTIRGVQKILKERGQRHVAQIGQGKTLAPHAKPAAVKKVEEKKPEAKKRSHLRAVPSPMSLPFFDMPESEFPAPPRPVGIPAEERVRLTTLLAELLALKQQLRKARSRAA